MVPEKNGLSKIPGATVNPTRVCVMTAAILPVVRCSVRPQIQLFQRTNPTVRGLETHAGVARVDIDRHEAVAFTPSETSSARCDLCRPACRLLLGQGGDAVSRSKTRLSTSLCDSLRCLKTWAKRRFAQGGDHLVCALRRRCLADLI